MYKDISNLDATRAKYGAIAVNVVMMAFTENSECRALLRNHLNCPISRKKFMILDF